MRYIFITILILITFIFSTPAQSKSGGTQPFDFADQTYKTFGVFPDAIANRRSGNDGLSVFDKLHKPFYSDVRVTATVPAYDQQGQMIFWYPVGDLASTGFTKDDTGYLSREYARGYPMYIFPDPKQEGFTTFSGHRHAPVLDLTRDRMAGPISIPLGIRQVFAVYYTERAFNTKDGWAMMQFMRKKNGEASDDTAILKTVDDIKYLEKLGYVDVKPLGITDGYTPNYEFTIAPVFYNPTRGAIYPDAKLLMTIKNGSPLAAEQMFVQQFECLLKLGDFCSTGLADL